MTVRATHSGRSIPRALARAPRMLTLALVMLALAGAAVRWGHGGEVPESALGPFMLGWLLLAGWVAGRLAECASLPRVTGYLLVGLIAGPGFSSLAHLPVTILDDRALSSVALIDDAAIALIGLLAGSELRASVVRPHLRVSVRLVGWQLALLAPAGAAALFAAAIAAPAGWTLEGSIQPSIILGSLAAGMVLVANSPAIVVAVIRELGAKGIVARTALATTILKDLVLTVAFTAVLGGAVALGSGGADDSSVWAGMGGVATHLIGSLLAGAIVGPVLAWIAARTPIRDDALVGLSAVVIVAVASHFDLSILLTSLAAGISAANLRRLEAGRLTHATDTYLVPVLCVAFPIIGARLDLGAALALAPVAIGLAMLRAGGLWLACRAALPTPSSAPPGLRSTVWMAFLPQAAVAIALLADFESQLGQQPWGRSMHTMLLGMVVFNALLGPAFLRLALRRDESNRS